MYTFINNHECVFLHLYVHKITASKCTEKCTFNLYIWTIYIFNKAKLSYKGGHSSLGTVLTPLYWSKFLPVFLFWRNSTCLVVFLISCLRTHSMVAIVCVNDKELHMVTCVPLSKLYSPTSKVNKQNSYLKLMCANPTPKTTEHCGGQTFQGIWDTEQNKGQGH